VDPPTGDNDYFERMSRVIFMSGLNWATLEKKWPGIKEAFRGFDIDTVAGLGESDVTALMENPAVIRNRPKIQAVIGNAREFQAVIDEHGSFAKYIGTLRSQGESAMSAAIAKRFAFMGPGTTRILLFAIGEQPAEAT
jgi:DNA-3-methyladenine glycosylase I